jgi:hypothetical protein
MGFHVFFLLPTCFGRCSIIRVFYYFQHSVVFKVSVQSGHVLHTNVLERNSVKI